MNGHMPRPMHFSRVTRFTERAAPCYDYKVAGHATLDWVQRWLPLITVPQAELINVTSAPANVQWLVELAAQLRAGSSTNHRTREEYVQNDHIDSDAVLTPFSPPRRSWQMPLGWRHPSRRLVFISSAELVSTSPADIPCRPTAWSTGSPRRRRRASSAGLPSWVGPLLAARCPRCCRVWRLTI